MSNGFTGSALPPLMYGTAWKEERTTELAGHALAAGFRAFDTANQRKHYYEEGLGQALEASDVPRPELFIQTKFTYQRGQDHRLPYDPKAAFADQVQQSLRSSFEHLGVDFIDSLVLHGPWSSDGWGEVDREVWAAMESHQQAGLVGDLGVSNIAADQLVALLDSCVRKPRFVQNRCYARTGWDREIRELCREHGLVYQGFSLLTANRKELASAPVAELAAKHSLTVPQLVFAFAKGVGMWPLTGTSDPVHMSADLEAAPLELEPADLLLLESLSG